MEVIQHLCNIPFHKSFAAFLLCQTLVLTQQTAFLSVNNLENIYINIHA